MDLIYFRSPQKVILPLLLQYNEQHLIYIIHIWHSRPKNALLFVLPSNGILSFTDSVYKVWKQLNLNGVPVKRQTMSTMDTKRFFKIWVKIYRMWPLRRKIRIRIRPSIQNRIRIIQKRTQIRRDIWYLFSIKFEQFLIFRAGFRYSE